MKKTHKRETNGRRERNLGDKTIIYEIKVSRKLPLRDVIHHRHTLAA